jgi:glycerol-3-phosphate O-acyltransferase
MNPLDGLARAWRWSVRKILGRWVKVTIKPDDVPSVFAARPRPVCYVLERESQADLAVLNNACAELHLPRPARRLGRDRRMDRAYFDLTERPPLWRTGARPRAPRYLVQLVGAAAADVSFDLDLVPVAIFWGRSPAKEQSPWRLLFTEEWVVVGRFRKFLNILFNRGDTVLYFGDPIRLRTAMGDLEPSRSVRRVLRELRAELRAQRASTIGPELSHPGGAHPAHAGGPRGRS